LIVVSQSRGKGVARAKLTQAQCRLTRYCVSIVATSMAISDTATMTSAM
jgi:hypothetical protein